MCSPPGPPCRLLDGKRYDQLDQSNTTLPRKEMYSAFSVWTKDSVDFGGVAPADGPNWSYFSDIRRLICDDVRIDPAFSAPVASVTPLASPAKVQVEQNNASSSTASVTSSATSASSSTAPAVAKMNVTTRVNGAASASASAGAALLSAAIAAAVLLL